MKIRGALVDILCEMNPIYEGFIVWEKRGTQKVLYTHVRKALYGLLESAMLFYKRLVMDLQQYGFKLNPYEPCVANKVVNDKQMTVSWHVDDLKVSHAEKAVVDDFLVWIQQTYGKLAEVKMTRGKLHDYLGMKLDYREEGQVSIDMTDYVKTMIDQFPEEHLPKGRVASPWTDALFRVDVESPKLPKQEAEQFHTTTAQGLFLCKRGRPDISPAIAFFTTRVKESTKEDWTKLVRMMQYLHYTKDEVLTLRADDSKTLSWHVDAAFAVHPDYKSHTGGILTMGKGAIVSISRKQKLNTRSSTEAELVAADDVAGPILWTANFLKAQGYGFESKLLQDNQSTIKLESNGRASAGKRSRHLNIRYFFIHDLKEKGHITIEYCPTEKILGDYMSKPLHGRKYNDQRDAIMNLVPTTAAQLMMFGIFAARA
jgi:hypothetical protein